VPAQMNNNHPNDATSNQGGGRRPGAPGAVKIQQKLVAAKTPRAKDKRTTPPTAAQRTKHIPGAARPVSAPANTAADATATTGTGAAPTAALSATIFTAAAKAGQAGGARVLDTVGTAPTDGAATTPSTSGLSARMAVLLGDSARSGTSPNATPTTPATSLIAATPPVIPSLIPPAARPVGDAGATNRPTGAAIARAVAAKGAAGGEGGPGNGRSGQPGRLRSGELRALVAKTLTARQGDGFTVTQLSNMLRRSPGAIANAAERLCEQGVAVRIAQHPRTYQEAPGKPRP
jgi:hypothetical protein